MFREINDLLDQILASEANPRRRRRRLPKCAGCGRETLDPWVARVTDQFLPSVPSRVSTMARWMSETTASVFTTLWRMSETAKFVFIASSVWKWTVNNGHTVVITERTLKM